MYFKFCLAYFLHILSYLKSYLEVKLKQDINYTKTFWNIFGKTYFDTEKQVEIEYN